MTNTERSEGMRKIKEIESCIQEIESRMNMKVLTFSGIVSDKEEAKVCFDGYNNICYEIPYDIFKQLPTKRIVIEVMRALTIAFNDYGEDGWYKYQRIGDREWEKYSVENMYSF